MSKSTDPDILFRKLDDELGESISSQYFSEPREFRSLIEVLGVLGEKADQINNTDDESKDFLTMLKDRNPAYSKLLKQRKIVEAVIEDVVKFQHGGLNNSVDTMSEVVHEYSRGRSDIGGLRKSLMETRSVLTAKKTGQIPLKELWLKKVELEESLRMVRDLESLKNTPHKVQRLMQQKRYFTAVGCLTEAISKMFGEDLVAVDGLSEIREHLMELKETLLETCVSELKEAIIGSQGEAGLKDFHSGTDSDGDDTRSESQQSSYLNGQSPQQHHQKMMDDRSSNRSYSITSHNMSYTPFAAAGSRAVTGTMPMLMMHSSSSHQNNSHHNGGGGGSVVSAQDSATLGLGLTHPGVVSSKDVWSTDFKDLDDTLESALVDPSSAGSVFLRLLVRTVGVLKCEEDVERLLLESVAKSFRYVSMQRMRYAASMKLQREMHKLHQKHSIDEGNNMISPEAIDEEELNLHTKLFSSYIGSLLDSCLLTMQRLLYVLKLLLINRHQRISTTGGSLSEGVGSDRLLKESNRKQVLQLWLEIEDIIVQEMKIHLVEPEVESISDHSTPSNPRAPRTLGSPSWDNPGGFSAALGFSGSEKKGNSLNRRRSVSPGGFAEDMGDEEGAPGGGSLLFRPSARHGALLYRRVSLYSSLVGRVTRDNALDDSKQGLHVLNKEPVTVSAQSVRENRVLNMIQGFLEEELVPVVQSTVNRVMREIQLNDSYFSILRVGAGKDTGSFALQEGLDVIGADRIRGIPLCKAASLCNTASKPLFTYWVQLQQHRGMVSTILDRLIRGYASAAREELEGLTYSLLTADKARKKALIFATNHDPFFLNYRFQTYEGKHTVEELLAWSSQTKSISSLNQENNSNSAAAKVLSNARHASATSIILTGGTNNNNSNNNGSSNTTTRNSIAGFYGGRSNSREGKSGSGLASELGKNRTRPSITQQQAPIISEQNNFEDFAYVQTTALEIGSITPAMGERRGKILNSAWEDTFWDVGSSTFPVSNQQLFTDSNALSSIGAICFGCDWLVKRLSSYCNLTTRKLNSSVGSSTSVSKTRNRSGSGSSNNAKANKEEAKMLLVTSVLGGVQELGRIAEESLAILRGELQVLCFFFLHKLAHIKFHVNNVSNKTNKNQPETPNSSSSIRSFNIGRSFSGGGSPSRKLTPTAAEEESTAEEDALMQLFQKKLQNFIDAISTSLPAGAVAVVLSPICSIIPRILLKCIIHTVTAYPLTNNFNSSSHSPATLGSVAPLSLRNVPTTAAMAEKQQKARLLRVAVGLQQSTSQLLQQLEILELDTRRNLVDTLTEQFEKIRRFLTLFNMPSQELQVYLMQNGEDFSKEEVQTLWSKSSNRDFSVTFDQWWKYVERNTKTKL